MRSSPGPPRPPARRRASGSGDLGVARAGPDVLADELVGDVVIGVVLIRVPATEP